MVQGSVADGLHIAVMEPSTLHRLRAEGAHATHPPVAHDRLRVAHLLEHSGGALPAWLSPVQVMVLPVAAVHGPAAAELVERLRRVGVRAEPAPADASLGARVRRAQERKIPYAVVLGDREVADSSAALRLRDGRQLSLPWDALVDELGLRVANRSHDLWG